MPNKITVLGLMSGTSLDGVDLCLTEFWNIEDTYHYSILKTFHSKYPKSVFEKLKNAHLLNIEEILALDVELGKFFGHLIKDNFAEESFDYISSHGHTILHQPEKGFTLQIGNPNWIKSICNKTVIYDFRSYDVALNGQGAPLVPIGDKFLFNEFDACINLGGFSNISFDDNKQRIAFDISPFNKPLNKICEEHFNLEFDNNGELASSGQVNQELLNNLNQLEYYHKKAPKSLGIEWLNEYFYPIISEHNLNAFDTLRTLTEHFSIQISEVLKMNQLKKVLFTGGGTFNKFFINNLKSKTNSQIIIPTTTIINYKEALIFAFMGYLRIKNKVNVLSSSTGASKNHVSGSVI